MSTKTTDEQTDLFRRQARDALGGRDLEISLEGFHRTDEWAAQLLGWEGPRCKGSTAPQALRALADFLELAEEPAEGLEKAGWWTKPGRPGRMEVRDENGLLVADVATEDAAMVSGAPALALAAADVLAARPLGGKGGTTLVQIPNAVITRLREALEHSTRPISR